MSKQKPDIVLKISELETAWKYLSDLVGINENPFNGHARRLLFKMQPDIKFIGQSNTEDIDAIKNETVNLGEKIPPPAHYPDEYTPILEKVCRSLPMKTSQVEQLLKNQAENGKAKEVETQS